MAALGALLRKPAYLVASTTVSGAFLCLPAALIALACLRLGAPVALGIAAVVFPKVFRYSNELLQEGAGQDHVVTARAKGLGPWRTVTWHVLPTAAPQLLALGGVSLSIGLGAAIPVEVLCDSPGIGQLAWRAAIGRDLSLLIGLTLVITALTLAANLLADAAVAGSVENRS
jgi:peptide/nickel transport system permease protein